MNLLVLNDLELRLMVSRVSAYDTMSNQLGENHAASWKDALMNDESQYLHALHLFTYCFVDVSIVND